MSKSLGMPFPLQCKCRFGEFGGFVGSHSGPYWQTSKVPFHPVCTGFLSGGPKQLFVFANLSTDQTFLQAPAITRLSLVQTQPSTGQNSTPPYKHSLPLYKNSLPLYKDSPPPDKRSPRLYKHSPPLFIQGLFQPARLYECCNYSAPFPPARPAGAGQE